MIRRLSSSPLAQYVLAGIGSVAFWYAYYYANSKVMSRSLLLAALDTAQYMTGYLIISFVLLPRFIVHKRAVYFGGGLMLLVILIGAMRIYEYKAVSGYYGMPYPVNVSSLLYVFTTTTFILGALSGARFTIDWLQSQKRLEEINKERANAELAFLKGQLNPHFFFNSINTLYGSIQSDNNEARSILLKLSDMLRYQLYECATDQVPLEKEINYIHNFIDLQKLRTNERLKVTFNTGQVNAALSVPPLLLAPLVENAFKHISKFANAENWIVVTLRVVHDKIHFTIQNSVETVPWSDPSPHRNGATAQHEERGIGLTNIQRRLRLIYGDKADLKIEAKSTVFTVTLLLPTT